MEQQKIFLDLILSNLAEEAGKAQETVTKASEVLLGPLSSDLATTPYDVVYEEDRVKLKHYRTPGGSAFKTPLLVTYALINRETMLDLQSDRSVVKTFLESGVDLYMIDWGYPTRKDRFQTIDDHVNGYMNNIVDYIRRTCGVPKINLMGICMGGTFSVIYAALHPEKIKNLITTVTPTSFDTDKGLLHIWMKAIDVNRLVDTFGNLSGDIMNYGFLLLNPARLMIDKYVGFFENMGSRSFVENFVRMEKWIFDSPDLPGETFRQFVTDFYQQNLLIQSRLKIGGRTVDLKKITMPPVEFFTGYTIIWCRRKPAINWYGVWEAEMWRISVSIRGTSVFMSVPKARGNLRQRLSDGFRPGMPRSRPYRRSKWPYLKKQRSHPGPETCC